MRSDEHIEDLRQKIESILNRANAIRTVDTWEHMDIDPDLSDRIEVMDAFIRDVRDDVAALIRVELRDAEDLVQKQSRRIETRDDEIASLREAAETMSNALGPFIADVERLLGHISPDESLDTHNLRMAAHELRGELS
jgi:Asp-tRNA(Asn)/Glu-tRNA(Gln) amidotransferase C subunit